MQVTLIEELTSTRSKIYIDGVFAFVLYKGELRLYGVCEGATIDAEDYEEIMTKVLPKRAKLRAMNLLQKREYTTKQLRDKLEQGFYPEKVIEQAISYVASYHYIDDLRYATQYIIFHEESRSKRRIEQDLLQKGITKEVFQKAWITWEEEGGHQNEEEQIRKLLRKRKYDPSKADYTETQKQMAFLVRKGFSVETIRRVLRDSDLEWTELDIF